MPRRKIDTSAFIEWLWAYRAKERIETRKELAARFGVPATTLSQWFAPKSAQPSLSALGAIARATGEDPVALARMAGYEHEVAERAGIFSEDPYERMARKLRAYDKIPAEERERLIDLLNQDRADYEAAMRGTGAGEHHTGTPLYAN